MLSALATPNSGVDWLVARCTSVVNTLMRAGLPIRRGTSKDSMPRTKSSRIVERIAGRRIGRVTRNRVWKERAPDMVAASSMRTSSMRRAGPSSR